MTYRDDGDAHAARRDVLGRELAVTTEELESAGAALADARRTRPRPPRAKRRWLLGAALAVVAVGGGIGAYLATRSPIDPTSPGRYAVGCAEAARLRDELAGRTTASFDAALARGGLVRVELDRITLGGGQPTDLGWGSASAPPPIQSIFSVAEGDLFEVAYGGRMQRAIAGPIYNQLDDPRPPVAVFARDRTGAILRVVGHGFVQGIEEIAIDDCACAGPFPSPVPTRPMRPPSRWAWLVPDGARFGGTTRIAHELWTADVLVTAQCGMPAESE